MAKENETLENTGDLTEKAAETVEEVVETAKEAAGDLEEKVQETAEQVTEEVKEELTLEEAAEEVAEEVASTVEKEDKTEKTVENKQTKASKSEEKKAAPRKYVSETKKMWMRIGAAAVLILVVAALALPLLNTKSPILANKTVLTVDGVKVPADEYSYYIGYLVDSYASYYGYEYFENPDNFAMIENYVNNVLKEHYVVYNWALEEGFALTEEQKQGVLDQIEETKASFESEEAYAEALASSHLTPELYERMLMSDTVINNFSDAIYNTETSKFAPDDSEVMDLGRENGIIASKHILMLPGETAEEDAEVLAKMNEILERLNNGEDFDALMNEYSEDPGLATYPNGYTFMDGEMVTEFYDATNALEVGGISGIVRSSSGYHIIKRIEPDFDETKSRLISLAVDVELESRISAAEMKLASGYDKIQFSDFNLVPETASVPAESEVSESDASDAA